MPNLRILNVNALDRTSSFSASNEVITAQNLRDQRRSQLWRAAGKTAALTLTWTNPELVRCVCMPHTNFTLNATMRVRGYSDEAGSGLLFDTGALNCTKYRNVNPWGFENLPLGINQYAYGGGSYAVLWFPGASVRRLVIDISDTTNPSNIEAAVLAVGDYWTPTYNASYGAGLTFSDLTKNERAASGDLVSDRGTRFRKLNMSLSLMPPEDRDALHNIFRNNGTHRPMLVSLYPEADNPQLEWDHMVWAKLTQVSAITIAQFNAYANSLDLEEI